MNKFRGRGGAGSPVPISKEMLQGGSEASLGGPRQGRVTFSEWFLGPGQESATDSVTGATITFTGISRALAQGERFVREEVGR